MAGPSNGKGKKRKRGEAHPAAAPVADANEGVDLVNLEGTEGLPQQRNDTVIPRAEQVVNQPLLLPAIADGLCSNLAMSSSLKTKTCLLFSAYYLLGRETLSFHPNL